MRKIIYFLLKLLGFYLIWLLFDNYLSQYIWFKKLWYYPQYILLDELILVSTTILSTGLRLSVEVISINQFLIEQNKIIEIGIPCFGHEIMYFFTIFIIAYPGPWKKKLYFIPFGLVLINLLNILRIVGLSLIFLYYPEYGDFNHHFLFTFIVYAFVFSMWLVWIRYFSSENNQSAIL